MKENEIRDLVQKLNVQNEEKIWTRLKPLEEKLLPYFLEYYPKANRYQTRLTYVFHSIKYARVNDDAVKLGVMALNDKVALVRYRACGLLAYSLRKDVIPHLKSLLRHPDKPTVEDAKAAIEAIEKQNHHLFIDRNNTGNNFWVINKEDERAY